MFPKGHEVHEWTSWAAFESVFEFFTKKYQEKTLGKVSASEAEPELAEEAAEMDTSDANGQTMATSDGQTRSTESSEKQGQDGSMEQEKTETMETEVEQLQQNSDAKDKGDQMKSETMETENEKLQEKSDAKDTGSKDSGAGEKSEL